MKLCLGLAILLAASLGSAVGDDVPEPKLVPGSRSTAGGDATIRAQNKDVDDADATIDDGTLPRAATERRAGSKASSESAGGDRMTPLAKKSQKRGPPELLAETMSTPPEKEFDGVATGLTAVLRRVRDPADRHRAIEAYWRLAAAQAEFVFLSDLREQLRRTTKNDANTPAAHSARASMRSAMIRAATTAYEYQHELADYMKLADGEQLPLAADRPHVGSYNTQFEKLLSRGAPPARLRLLDRLLPIRREAIDIHAAAVVAAEDALNAAIQGMNGTSTISHLLTTFDQLAWEQRQFQRSVRNYNIEIAEYLLAVMPESTNAETLVKALLTNPVQDRPPAASDDDQTRLDGPRNRDIDRLAFVRVGGDSPVDHAATSFNHRSPFVLTAVASDQLYQPLLTSKPAERAQQLSELLHSHELLPEKLGRAIKLSQCLASAPTADRLAVIEAYWDARESTARFQAFRNEIDQLDRIKSLAVAAGHEAGGEKALLDQRAALTSARAELMDEEATLVEAQFALTVALRQPLDQDWLLPITPPQSGGYDSATRRAGDQQRRRWLTRMIAARYEELSELATAVVFADDERAAASSPTLTSGHNHFAVERAVAAIQSQTDLTLDFVRCARRYNVAIAEYAIDVLGSGASAATLLKALVLPSDDA